MMLVIASLVFLLAACSNGQVISRSLSVNEGDTASFSCNGFGPHLLQYNSNVTTSTRLVQDDVDESSGDDGTSTVYYSLSSTSRSDNGTTIVCFFNGITTEIFTILVDYLPRYSPVSSTYIVVEGSSPQVLLHLDAFPKVTQYTWSKDGEQIQSNDRLTLHAEGLVFNNILRHDSGTYSVIADNGDQDNGGQATIDLIVYYSPIFNEGSNIISLSAVAGDDITLPCGSSATPTILDTTLSYDNVDTVSNIVQTDSSFVITSAVLDNTGIYTCTAENIVGIRELKYNLTVKANPKPTTTTTTATITPTTTESPTDQGDGVLDNMHVTKTTVLLIIASLTIVNLIIVF